MKIITVNFVVHKTQNAEVVKKSTFANFNIFSHLENLSIQVEEIFKTVITYHSF